MILEEYYRDWAFKVLVPGVWLRVQGWCFPFWGAELCIWGLAGLGFKVKG